MKKPEIPTLLALGSAAALASLLGAHAARRTRRPALRPEHPATALRSFTLFFVFPVWLAAGAADFLYHAKSKIWSTSGLGESLTHSLMMATAGPAVLTGIFLEGNAGSLAVTLGGAIGHQLLAMWDLLYTAPRRVTTGGEQNVHTFLVVAPFSVASAAVAANWRQFLALLGRGPERPDFELRLMRPLLPKRYVVGIFAAMTVLGALPHLAELVACYQGERKGITGRDTPECIEELFA